VSIDRDATLRKAEKLLRQGRLDQAIAEYIKVIHEQPRDWSTVNAVGDLLVRSGQLESGVEHFKRIADHLFDEGFLPRAAAVYKKILKLKPDEEHAALRTAEISERQGLLADAKAALMQVAERRVRRGDKHGAAEIHLRVGALDPSDLASGVGAARAAAELGDTAGAVQRLLQLATECHRRQKLPESIQALDEAIKIDPENRDVRSELVARFIESADLERAAGYASSASEFKAIASEYYSRGRGEDALQVLQWALEQDPGDSETRRQLVRSYIGRDDLERARELLSGDIGDADLLLSLAEIELRTGRRDEGRALVCRVLTQDPGRRDDVVLLGGRLGAGDAESAFQCIDVATDAAVTDHDWTYAANALQDYVAQVPGHVPALMKLVEVCVDGGLDATMYAAQTKLADAYLNDGQANEARVIAEDLVAREPWEPANIERLRSALKMLGESDPDSVIADRLSGDSPFTSADLSLDFSFRELAAPTDGGAVPTPAAAAGRSGDGVYLAGPASIDLGGILGAEAKAADEAASDTFEIDLSAAFGGFGEGGGGAAESGDAAPAPAGLSGLERVFEGFRDEAVRYGVEGAAKQFRQAVSLREAGDTGGAVRVLEQVVRVPRYRFKAAAELARIHRELGQVHEAVEWLERAAEAAPAATDESRELLYDLGLLLSEAGESERALAVFLELQSDAPDYRDVAIRVGRLSQKA
jgi:tetratricopeptide (TPR) repeat protein